MKTISSAIEAVLFFRNEPVLRAELAKILHAQVPDIEEGLKELQESLKERGVVLVDDGKEVSLRTSPQHATFIENMRKEELSRDLGPAGLETLAIVLYKGPSTKAEIEFIRGVNCAYILRALLMRGLLRKISNPKDERSYLYETTNELLAHVGISSREKLPKWQEMTAELEMIFRRAHDGGAGEVERNGQ